MIKKLVHFSDLHVKLFKDHDQYRKILENAIDQWRELEPDRIVFTGDLVHSKNQMTPELIEMVSWLLLECSKIAKTIMQLKFNILLSALSKSLDNDFLASMSKAFKNLSV